MNDNSLGHKRAFRAQYLVAKRDRHWRLFVPYVTGTSEVCHRWLSEMPDDNVVNACATLIYDVQHLPQVVGPRYVINLQSAIVPNMFENTTDIERYYQICLKISSIA